jgi:hypothetical protein
VHQDPVTKSQRVTNGSGTVTSIIDLDPCGGETFKQQQSGIPTAPIHELRRDGNESDEAMMRRYAGEWHRFMQPDPYDGGYD